MNRRSFLKWFGAGALVAATTDPVKLLEGLAEPMPVINEVALSPTVGGVTDFSRLTAITREHILPSVSEQMTSNHRLGTVLAASSDSDDGLMWVKVGG